MLLIFLKLKLEVQSNSNISVMPDSIFLLKYGRRPMLKIHLAGFDFHKYNTQLVLIFICMFNLAAFDYHSIHFHLLYRGFRFSLQNIFFTLLFVLLVAFSLRMRILVKMGKLPFSHLAAFDFHLLYLGNVFNICTDISL